MGQHSRRESYPSASSSRLDYHHHHLHIRRDVASIVVTCADKAAAAAVDDLAWPLERLPGLNDDEVRETAYEIFFTSCRSSPGFGGRQALTFYSNHENNVGGGGEGGAGKGNQVVTKPISRVKRMLGLKMLKRSPSRRMTAGSSGGGSSTPSSPVGGAGSPLSHTVPPLFRPRRPMTAAEIMRQQMRVTEHDDNRLRKTLMRTLVGQVHNLFFFNYNLFIDCSLVFSLKFFSSLC